MSCSKTDATAVNIESERKVLRLTLNAERGGLPPGWEPVPQERSQAAEGSASQSTLGNAN